MRETNRQAAKDAKAGNTKYTFLALLATWRFTWPRLLTHALALVPLAWLALRYASNTLPINLNRYLLLRSGTIGLVLLLASLACTPAALLGWRWATQLRRPLGLYAFAYMVGHLLVYAVLDNAVDLELIARDLGERRSMSVGLLALLLLLPLAVTSTRGWQRRLGTRWRALHRLIYLAAPLAVLHYFWLERDDIRAPLVYAALLAVLLVLRLPPLRRGLARTIQKKGF